MKEKIASKRKLLTNFQLIIFINFLTFLVCYGFDGLGTIDLMAY